MPRRPELDNPPANYTSIWTRADAMKVHADDPTTTQPLIPVDFPIMNDELWVWDTWPLMDIQNRPLTFKNWHVIFSLTAPRSVGWEDRHGLARIGYWFSRDAKSWIWGGHLFAEGASPTTREWAGSTLMFESNRVEVYYTTVSPGSRITKTTGRIFADADGVWFTGFQRFRILFEADGVYYQTEEQNAGWGFRDPWLFRHRVDGKIYALFEGNVAGVKGSHVVGPDEIGPVPPGTVVPNDANLVSACIGIAVALDEDRNQWKLLPPLLTAVGVNDQTERPHFVLYNGRYYLFTISHTFTYAAGLTGPDGVYGFVSDSLWGPYIPLNGSGLVLGNPSSQPFQSYSHYVMPNGLVESFIDNVPDENGEAVIGGTLAPTVRIVFEEAATFLVNEYDFGYIPAMRAWPISNVPDPRNALENDLEEA